jgi:hypothetical protein
MPEAKKCAHPSCACLTTEKYCSAFCEGQADHPDIECECGHGPCAEKPAASLA